MSARRMINQLNSFFNKPTAVSRRQMERRVVKKKRTEITIETSRLLIVSKPNKVVARCNQCGAEVNWVTTDEAAILSHVNSRTIFQLAEAGQLHTTESTEGLLLVCLNSLRI